MFPLSTLPSFQFSERLRRSLELGEDKQETKRAQAQRPYRQGYITMHSSLTPDINNEPLRVTVYIVFFSRVKTSGCHPAFNLVFAHKHFRTVSVWSLWVISVHLDQRNAASRLDVGAKRFQIGLPILNVMKDIMKERQIYIVVRELGITELSFNRLNIGYVLLFGFLRDVIQETRIDIDRVNFAGWRNCFSE